MKCSKCGAETEGKFCQYCGSALEDNNAEIRSENSAPQTAWTSVEPQMKTKKPIYKKWWAWVIVVIIGFGIINAIGDDTPADTVSNTTAGNVAATTTKSATTTKVATTTKATAIKTVSQINALKKAKSYLDFMAFSRLGLIEQLEFEKFSHKDAVYAVDNCGANWNEQAAKKAKSYLDLSAFSREGLIEQLEFEKFTHQQAVYGVNANGL